jgi:putative transcriptional regulator
MRRRCPRSRIGSPRRSDPFGEEGSSKNPGRVTNRLRVLRAERGWTQADLAQALEDSRQTVNAIETGKYDPSLPLAFKWARLFGRTIEEIFQDQP